MYYILLIVAAILYALSFYFNRNVERQCKDGIDTVILFSTVTWAETLIVLLVIMGGKMQFTLFSVICAIIHSAILLTYAFLNFKSLAVVDLTEYSLFSMLGGMLVPFFFGIIFLREDITVGKIICCVLVSVGLYICSYGGKIQKKALLYLIGVFLINGSIGVMTTIHQNGEYPKVDTLSYMCMQAIILLVFGILWFGIKKITGRLKNPVNQKKAYKNMLGYGLVNGSAELILLYSIINVDASVQYPIITGGVIIFSTLISMIIGEEKNIRNLVPVAIIFVGLLFLLK